DTVLDQRSRRCRRAFSVEHAGSGTTDPTGIIADLDPGREDPLAHTSFEKACTARYCGSVDRTRQMPQQAAGNTRIEHDREPGGTGARRVQTGDRPFTGA